MAIDVYELPRRAFETDAEGNESAPRAWKVVCDTLNPAIIDITTAVGVNQYDAHPDRPAAIAQTIRATQQEGDGVVWLVEISYSSKPFKASQQPDDAAQQAPSKSNSKFQPPELRPAVWSFDRKEYMRVLEFDAINPAIEVQNSAGQPFDPPVEVVSSNMLIRVEFYRAFFSLTTMRGLWDKVNDAAWQGFAARTLRINDVSAKSTYEKAGEGGGLLAYWTISLELEYSRKPWNPLKIRDRGSAEKILQDGNYLFRTIKGDGGDPMIADLNGAGLRLAANAKPVYRDFNAYEEVSFTAKFF